jgi:hypothetical protein
MSNELKIGFATVRNNGISGKYSNVCFFISVQDYLKYVLNINKTIDALRNEIGFEGGLNDDFDVFYYEKKLENWANTNNLAIHIYYVFNGTEKGIVANGKLVVGTGRNIINIVSYGAHFEWIVSKIGDFPEQDPSIIAKIRNDGRFVGEYVRKYENVTNDKTTFVASLDELDKDKKGIVLALSESRNTLLSMHLIKNDNILYRENVLARLRLLMQDTENVKNSINDLVNQKLSLQYLGQYMSLPEIDKLIKSRSDNLKKYNDEIILISKELSHISTNILLCEDQITKLNNDIASYEEILRTWNQTGGYYDKYCKYKNKYNQMKRLDL